MLRFCVTKRHFRYGRFFGPKRHFRYALLRSPRACDHDSAPGAGPPSSGRRARFRRPRRRRARPRASAPWRAFRGWRPRRSCDELQSGELVAPGGPAWPAMAGEQFEPGPVAIALDPLIGLVWLARMLAHRRQDDFAHVLGEAPRAAAPGE